MRRTLTAALLCLTAAGLTGCNTITGDPVQTEMLVANHTGSEITVSFDQHADNTKSNPIRVDQPIGPDRSVRYTGKQGDEVVIHAANQPPLRLIFARRSQTVFVSDEDGQLSYEIKRGYRDPGTR